MHAKESRGRRVSTDVRRGSVSWPLTGRWRARLVLALSRMCLAALACSSPFLASAAVHQLHLGTIDRSAGEVTHPEESELIATFSGVGNFQPTGNQCDYVSCQIRSFTGKREQLMSHYRQTVRLKGIEWGLSGVDDEPVLPSAPRFEIPMKMRKNAATRGGGKVYVVWFLDGGKDDGLDCRCW